MTPSASTYTAQFSAGSCRKSIRQSRSKLPQPKSPNISPQRKARSRPSWLSLACWTSLVSKYSQRTRSSNFASTTPTRNYSNSSISTCLLSSRKSINKRVSSGRALPSKITNTPLLWSRSRGRLQFSSFSTNNSCFKPVEPTKICFKRLTHS